MTIMLDEIAIEHGNYRISLDNNIVRLSFAGEANEQCVQHYVEEVSQLVNQIDHRPYAFLLDATLFRGATPEAYAISDKYNQQLNRSPNFAGKAVIVNDCQKVLFDISVSQQPSVKEQLTSNRIQPFFDEPRALNWLKQRINEHS